MKNDRILSNYFYEKFFLQKNETALFVSVSRGSFCYSRFIITSVNVSGSVSVDLRTVGGVDELVNNFYLLLVLSVLRKAKPNNFFSS